MGGGISYFDVLFLKCGAIGWLLWVLSVATLAIIVSYLLSIRREKLLPAEVLSEVRSMIAQKHYREALDLTAGAEDLLGCVLYAAMSESARGYHAMERAMEEAAEERAAGLLRKIEWLNLIGNIGPMLGLLGTVWGMILAFFTIVEKGGIPEPGELAGAIGIALVTTLEGLMIAIPALAVYAMLRNRIDSLTGQVLVTCQDLISVFRAPRKSAMSPATQEREPAVAEA
jgi:biopolymer transport protein ExbB